jgi:hypothetical protein
MKTKYTSGLMNPTRFILDLAMHEKKYFEKRLVFWLNPDISTSLLNITPY